MDTKDRLTMINELASHQLVNVEPHCDHLDVKHLKRLFDGFAGRSFIDNDNCLCWHLYVRRDKTCTTGIRHDYVMLFHNGKKKVLARLLYMNFIGSLTSHEYLRNQCHTDKCVNPRHFMKRRYTKQRKPTVAKDVTPPTRAVLPDDFRVAFD